MLGFAFYGGELLVQCNGEQHVAAQNYGDCQHFVGTDDFTMSYQF
jgi:hypothetical protein